MLDATLLRDCDDQPGLIAPDAALARILAGVEPAMPVHSLGREHCLGRVLAAPIHAPVFLPACDAAAMDGFALTADDLIGLAPLRVVARIAAGDLPGRALAPGETARVLTGAPIPAGTAAVLMEEHARLRGAVVEVLRPALAGQNIRRRGEDMRPGQAVLPAELRLGARHLALLAALGIEEVPVHRALRVGVLSNGNELLSGAVRDSNRPMLLALLQAAGAEPVDLGLLGDDPAGLVTALRTAAARVELIICSGGVSGSDADHVVDAVWAAGGSVETLHLAQKPGKPLAHGRIGDTRCLLLPGNPLAAYVAMATLGLPLVARLAGAQARPARLLPGILAQALRRRPGRCEYRPARIMGNDDLGRAILEPLGRGGSAALLPLAEADVLLRIPPEADSLAEGAPIFFLDLPREG